MSLLRSLLRGEEPDSVSGDLATPALEIAAIQYPGLEPEPWLAELEEFGAELRRRLSSSLTAVEKLREATSYFFEELGFSGNDSSYYDPRNSCLNEVLARRTGIPITLTVVFMEGCRRAGLPIAGIGMPGHFLAEYQDGLLQTYIDCFHGGTMLTAAECVELARSRGAVSEGDRVPLPRVTRRQILIRMLANLRGIYLEGADWPRSLAVVELLLEAQPQDAVLWRQRGAVLQILGRVDEAKRSLEHYLILAEGAADRQDVERQIRMIQKQKAVLN